MEQITDDMLLRFGHSTGDYWSRCWDCEKQITDVDKRCRCCKECVIKRYKNHLEKEKIVNENKKASSLKIKDDIAKNNQKRMSVF